MAKIKMVRLEYVILVVLIFFVFFSYQLIKSNINVNYLILEQNIEKNSIVDDESDNIRLLLKLTNSARSADNSSVDDEFDMLESDKIFDPVDQTFQIVNMSYLDKLNIFLINGLRSLLGKDKLVFENLNNFYSSFSIALVMEYEDKYTQAIKYLYQSLVNISDKKLKSKVMYHIGYCYIMLGKFDEGKQALKNVDPANEDVYKNSKIMYHYVDIFQHERKMLMDSDLSELEKAQKLTEVFGYKLALEILDKISKNNTDKSIVGDIDYYKGLCYDQIGQKEKAINNYVSAIKKSGTTGNVSKLANRKIYFSSYKIKDGNEIRNMSVKIAKTLNDDKIEQVVEKVRESRVIKRDRIVIPKEKLEEIAISEKIDNRKDNEIRNNKVERELHSDNVDSVSPPKTTDSTVALNITKSENVDTVIDVKEKNSIENSSVPEIIELSSLSEELGVINEKLTVAVSEKNVDKIDENKDESKAEVKVDVKIKEKNKKNEEKNKVETEKKKDTKASVKVKNSGPKKITVKTKDGQMFFGYIESDNGKILKIRSIIGIIALRKEDIEFIEDN